MTKSRSKWILLSVVLLAGGCLRIIDLDDDENDVDAIVVPVDSAVTGDALLDCAIPLPCPGPEAGRATLCGRIYDTESDDVLEAPSPTRQACASTSTSGPCALRVRYYDALDFAMNPGGAPPLVPTETVVDDCGRFRAQNMTRATFGFIAIVTDDAPGIAPDQPHRMTNVVFTNAEAMGNAWVRAYATLASTDQLWSSTAGLSGMSFAQRGVLMKVFLYRENPVPGVTVTRNGSTSPGDDYYFSDTGITRRTVNPAQTATGANGSVLMINSPSPIEHSGTGAEPAGCRWPANLNASIQGVVYVDRKEAETSTGAACP